MEWEGKVGKRESKKERNKEGRMKQRKEKKEVNKIKHLSPKIGKYV